VTIMQLAIGNSLQLAAIEYLDRIRSNKTALRNWFGSILSRYEEELDDVINLWEHTRLQPPSDRRDALLGQIGDEMARLERISSAFMLGNVDESFAKAAADWRNERSST
jgi:hypothetical protein